MAKELSNNKRRTFLKAMTGIGAGFFLSKLVPSVSAYDRPSHDATDIKGKFEDISFNPTTEPGSSEGKLYYNDTDHRLKVHNGATWKDIGYTGATGFAPVGSITPWLQDYPNTPALPDGWELCDGHTINDIDSPYNGDPTPNLNGQNRFLRGSNTSGGTGGSITHAHSLAHPANRRYSWITGADGESIVYGFGGFAANAKQFLRSATVDTSSIPPYYNVVWIMKIK